MVVHRDPPGPSLGTTALVCNVGHVILQCNSYLSVVTFSFSMTPLFGIY